MEVHDEDGDPIKATFRVEVFLNKLTVVLNSASGGKGGERGKNADYNTGLETILRRLGRLGATLTDAYVDSKEQRGKPIETRGIMPEGTSSIVLTQVADFYVLRNALTRAQAAIGKTDTGSRTKTIRLVVEVLGFPPDPASADRLELILSGSRDSFGSQPPRVEWPATPAELEEARRNLGDNLEKRVEVWQRAEQSALREELLRGAATGQCALCGRVMDSRFLVAAHIKKRSACEDAEKRDLANIGMLNCRFGCDELYERGFISIGPDWQILRKSSLADETAIQYTMTTLRPSIPPRPSSAKYFTWHREHHNF